MALEQKTMTAPRAIIKVDGKAVGYIRNIRATETMQRGSARGLGRLTDLEKPILGITCTWSCDFFLVDLKRTGIPGLNNRQVSSQEQYQNTLMLLERPVDILIAKKDMVTEENGVVTSTKDTTFAKLGNVYLSSESFDVTENAISSKNQSGEYTEPILFPPI